MRKIIKITESQLKQMVKEMIMEQPTTSKYTRENPLKPKNDPYEYAYEDNVLYTKNKGETNWREISRENLGDNYKFDSAIGAIKNKFGKELGMSNLPNEEPSKSSTSTVLPTKNTYTRNSPLRPKNDPYEYANENGNIFTKKRESSEWVELPASQRGKNVVYDIARDAIIRKHGTELNVMK
jgi:hypothetical protein